MIDILLIVIAALLYATLGGFFVKLAVDNFKAHRYFLFGFDLMTVVYHSAWILKLVFEY